MSVPDFSEEPASLDPSELVSTSRILASGTGDPGLRQQAPDVPQRVALTHGLLMSLTRNSAISLRAFPASLAGKLRSFFGAASICSIV